MKSVSLTAYPRTVARRTGVKKLRAVGRVPAVIYGRNTRSQNLELTVKDIEELIHHSASETVLVDLAVQGDSKAKRLALVQEVQHHPLSGHVLHVDFHEVAEDEKVTVLVPVETVGEAEGVKTGGGVLEHVLFRIKVRALPRDLPEVIEVDVSKLEIGQAIHLGEIPLPERVEVIGDKNVPVIAVAAPITEAQEAAALESATTPLAEPEVIKEKKEEEGAEGEKPAAKGAEKGAAKPTEKGAEKAAAEKGEKAEKKPEKKK
jgi:large subunit ribosomal protein L25